MQCKESKKCFGRQVKCKSFCVAKTHKMHSGIRHKHRRMCALPFYLPLLEAAVQQKAQYVVCAAPSNPALV
jgi:hypothetical protein